MLKRYFLTLPPSQGLFGVLIGLVLGLMLLIIYAVLSPDTLLNGPMSFTTFFGPTIVLGVVFFTVGRIYVHHSFNYRTPEFRPNLLLRVVNGRAIESGRALWRGDGEIVPVSTSVVWRREPSMVTATAKLKDIGPKQVDVDVRIEATVPERGIKTYGLAHGFDPQELADMATMGYKSVTDLLAASFINRVLSPLIKVLEVDGQLSGSPFSIAATINAALEGTTFPFPLSNFLKVEVAVIPKFDEVKKTYP